MSWIVLRPATMAIFVVALGCNDGSAAALAKARAGDPGPLCHAVCERVSTCGASPTFEGLPACTSGCAESEDWSNGNREPMARLVACELTLSCAELGALFTGTDRVPTDPCEPERQALLDRRPPEQPFIYFQF